VRSTLKVANERLDRRYELRRRGYDLETIERRVGEVLGVDREVIYAKRRRKRQVEARSLFCYWAVRELGVSNTELGRKLAVSQPAVGYAVKMGRKSPTGMDSIWNDKDTYFLTDVPNTRFFVKKFK
jgi:putative transposase